MSAPKPTELDQIIAEGRAEEESAQLTEHQRKVIKLLFKIEDFIIGFPNTPLKVQRLAILYAKFASTEPHKGNEHTPPWKKGIIPAAWLMETIANSCEFMPAPIVAREIYCVEFPPLDKIEPRSLPQVCRRREAKEEE
jgi:hypothetical protein